MVDCMGSLMVGLEFMNGVIMRYAGEEAERMTLKRQNLEELLAEIRVETKEPEKEVEPIVEDKNTPTPVDFIFQSGMLDRNKTIDAGGGEGDKKRWSFGVTSGATNI